MKTAIAVSFFSLLTLFSYQGAPTPPFQPLNVGGVNAQLEPLNEPDVFLVNMIPWEQSEEQRQDSEPFVAVNRDESLIVGSAFQGKFDERTGAAPLVLLSTDKGLTWKPKPLLGGKQVGGQTYCFSGKENSFYGAVLTIGGTSQRAVSVFHTDDPLSDQPLESISTLSSGPAFGDTPFIQANTGGPAVTPEQEDTRVDRVYVGQNYFGDPDAQITRTASVRVSVENGKGFKLFGLEARDTGSVGQDGPMVRPALAGDTVYVAFQRWTEKERECIGRGPSDLSNPCLLRGDVIVTRDDQAAAQQNSFLDLVDPSDGLPGRIVARDRVFSFSERLGNQRVISPLSLAVHPSRSEVVYVAWSDYDLTTRTHVLHFRRSTDKGQNWTEDLRKIDSAINASVAVNQEGVVGLLYQQFFPKNAFEQERWETHFLKSEDGGSFWTDIPLTSIPTSDEPKFESDPFFGYRTHLLAVGTNFYGVFSAVNKPDPKYFPQGVKFQRNHAPGKLYSTDGKSEPTVSIDPYFFRIAGPLPVTAAVYMPAAAPIGTGRVAGLVAKFGWPVGIVGGILFSGFALVELFRARKERRALDAQIHGHSLTNYSGYVGVRVIDVEGTPITTVRPGGAVHVHVQFAPRRPDERWLAHIDLKDGENKPEVVFTVVLDTHDFEISPEHQSISVPLKETRSVDFDAVSLKPHSEQDHTLFVQVFQRTLLVQVVTVKL